MLALQHTPFWDTLETVSGASVSRVSEAPEEDCRIAHSLPAHTTCDVYQKRGNTKPTHL